MDDPTEASQISTDFSQPDFDPFPITRFTNFGDFRYYYAYGNTPAEDFLENVAAGVREPAVLSLGCGDIRSCLYTLWKYFSPEHRDKRFNGVHFVLNDYSAAVLARNVLFLHLSTQMPSEQKSRKQWIAALWAIWYSHELKPKHAHVLEDVLKTLLTYSENHQAWVECPLGKVVRFLSHETLRVLHKTWKMWYKRDVPVSSVADMHQARQQRFEKKTRPSFVLGNTMESVSCGYVSKNTPPKKGRRMEGEIEDYFKTGCCFAETVLNVKNPHGQTFINFTLYERADGKYNLHYESIPYLCYFHVVEFSPTHVRKMGVSVDECSFGLVEDEAFAHHPLLANSVQQFASWIMSSAKMLQRASLDGVPKISFSLECSDAIKFCQKQRQLPEAFTSCTGVEPKFDVIYSSNLFDHVAPPSLVLAAAPLLRQNGLLFATSLKYKSVAPTGSQYLQTCLGFSCKLLPLLCGLRCIGMEGEYADTTSVHPEPPTDRKNVFQGSKLFIWQRVQSSPLRIADLNVNNELVDALESSVLGMVTALFHDSTAIHTTNFLCTETVMALLIAFASNFAADAAISRFTFWEPLCSRLRKLNHIKAFLLQLQIQALLHGLHLHLTVMEQACPLCNDLPLTSFLQQFSVAPNPTANKGTTPVYLVCLHKSSSVDFESIRYNVTMHKVMIGCVTDAYLEAMSSLGDDVHLIDSITGREIEQKLNLDFFVPHYLVAEGYHFKVVAYQMFSVGNQPFCTVSLPEEVAHGKLTDIRVSQISYSFQRISNLARKPTPASSFGRVVRHYGGSNKFESVVSLSSAVQSSLESNKIITVQVSESEIQISCGSHCISLCYPYPVAYDRVNIRVSRQKGTVTVISPRKPHCFYTERPMFIASPDVPASLPSLQLDNLYNGYTAVQFTSREQLQHYEHYHDPSQHLPVIVKLKESWVHLFQHNKEILFELKISGRAVGFLVVHNSVFDLQRKAPAIDLSFSFPSGAKLLHIFFQLGRCFPGLSGQIRIIAIDEEEFELLKKVLSYFAARTTSLSAASQRYVELLKKHNILQHFTRAVVYPLYTDPDVWLSDRKYHGGEVFQAALSQQSFEKPSDLPGSVLGEVCHFCHKLSSDLKFCGKCHQAQYCSRECQVKHWKSHKRTCHQTEGAKTSNAPAEATTTLSPSMKGTLKQKHIRSQHPDHPPEVPDSTKNSTTLQSVSQHTESTATSFRQTEGTSPISTPLEGTSTSSHSVQETSRPKYTHLHSADQPQEPTKDSTILQSISQPTKRTAICNNCHKTSNKMKMCKGCKSVHYCNADCQKSHWSVHKTQCRPNITLPVGEAQSIEAEVDTTASTEGSLQSAFKPTPGHKTPSKGHVGQAGDSKPLLACSFCHEPSTNLNACTGCRKAHYCNKVCQSNHWSEHKQHCHEHKNSDCSISVTPTPRQPPTDSSVCSGCNKASRTLRNCRCHLAAYCSVECQRNDWPRHKDKCTAKSSRK